MKKTLILLFTVLVVGIGISFSQPNPEDDIRSVVITIPTSQMIDENDLYREISIVFGSVVIVKVDRGMNSRYISYFVEKPPNVYNTYGDSLSRESVAYLTLIIPGAIIHLNATIEDFVISEEYT